MPTPAETNTARHLAAIAQEGAAGLDLPLLRT